MTHDQTYRKRRETETNQQRTILSGYVPMTENKTTGGDTATDIFSNEHSSNRMNTPDVLDYKDAIRNSYWVHGVQLQEMFKTSRSTPTPAEKTVIKRTMLAIARSRCR